MGDEGWGDGGRGESIDGIQKVGVRFAVANLLGDNS